ncbi:MAG: hypothetical protein ACTSRZ_19735 [Promethearchaeota archaeon]
MKNFLVTAMGRSGTKFLSTVMNQSKVWTVGHEPKKANDLKIDILHIQKRFNQDHYGEVNSYLRYKVDEIKVAKKGVILRDPAEIWLSIANRHPKERWKVDLEDLEKSIIRLLYYSTKKEFLSISFKLMIQDKDYLDEILKYFGIKDVNITDEILNTKINATKEYKFHSIEQFNSQIQYRIYDLKDKMRNMEV